MSWRCRHCDYSNKAASERCEVCDELRSADPPPSQATSAISATAKASRAADSIGSSSGGAGTAASTSAASPSVGGASPPWSTTTAPKTVWRLIFRPPSTAPVTFFEAMVWSAAAVVLTAFLVTTPVTLILYAVIGGVVGYSDHLFENLFLVSLVLLGAAAIIEPWRRYVLTGRRMPRPSYPGERIAAVALPSGGDFGRRLWLFLVGVVIGTLTLALLPFPQWLVGALVLLSLIPGFFWLGAHGRAISVLAGYGLIGILITAGLSIWFLFGACLAIVAIWIWATR